MITGKNYIGNELSAKGEKIFHAYNPRNSETLAEKFYCATPTEVEETLLKSDKAANIIRLKSAKEKSEFLLAIADEIENLGEELIERASLESGLPVGRITGERGRTVNQIKLFAQHLIAGTWIEASIDTAIPERTPVPKPDVRKMRTALGTTVVFGASNFPLAFSTMGGDTVSALAAGCPIIVKAHPAHPGTNELVSSAVISAVKKCNFPDGTFSSLNDNGFNVGTFLVKHKLVKSVAFTGSFKGGKTLYDIAQKRTDPIPVFSEMGSINPVVLFPNGLKNNEKSWAEKYANSINLGAGQFCTNPGLLIGLASDELNKFKVELSKSIQKLSSDVMLTENISKIYSINKNQILSESNVSLLAESNNFDSQNNGRAAVAVASGQSFLENANLHKEIFGPFSLLLECKTTSELKDVINSLEGQLTGTIIISEEESRSYNEIILQLQNKVGRIIFNGIPTGVEVCNSMHHGGPFPATTDSRFTSVGTDAIKRFTRPICFQDFPNHLLPIELQNENKLNIFRTVNGELTKGNI